MTMEIQKPQSVLVVDDMDSGRYITVKILRKVGFEVWEAATGEDALLKASQGPDIVLLDINLPDMNGIEVCRRLKSNPKTAYLPVLHLSATSLTPPEIDMSGFGSDGFLMEPVDPAELVATVRVLLKMKDTEKLLRESERRFRTALQSIGEAVISVDTQGRVEIFNPAAASLMGIGFEQAHGRSVSHIFNLLDAATGQVVDNPVFQAMAENSTIRIGEHVLLRRPDGSEIPISVSGAPIRDDLGIMTGAILVARDLSQEAALQRELEESAHHYKTLANSGQALIWTSGLDGSCNYFNDIWLDFTGKSMEQEVGTGWVAGVHPEDLEYCLGIYTSHFSRQENFSMEYRLRTRDGTYRWVLDEGSPRYDSTGQFIGFIGHCLDITERKIAEDRIRRMNVELEERVRVRTQQLELANKELEAFSFSVSHDLRAPLRALSGYSEALVARNQERFDEESLHFAERIMAAATRMGDLIDSLLELSRVSKQGLSLEMVDLSSLAETVLAGLRDRNPERKVDCSVRQGMTASCDPRLLRIVFENLLENAWKFTGKREIARIEVGGQDTAGETVYFVADNGAGFDMEYATKLFSPFQRLHKTSEFPGTGIGLATVQRIIVKHGGRIWVEAKPDEGARFSFTLAG